jgi:hypothetical protein
VKLIDDEKLQENQVMWFEKQRKEMAIGNFNAKGISEKDREIRKAMDNGSMICATHLVALRALLNEKGLMRLSNSLASARKRLNSDKKSLQLMLNPSTISKLESMAEEQGMSLSEYFESLV